MVTRQIPKAAILVRLTLSKDEYDLETRNIKVRPQPDACNHYVKSDFDKAEKNESEIINLNTLLVSTRKKCMPELLTKFTAVAAHDLITHFERAAVRLCFGKKPLDMFPAVKGKYSG